jgi:pyruvate dehydrogenase E1 component alpha subunit
LLQLGISEGEIETIEAETQKKIDEATEIARNAPPADESIALIDVWADGGAAWRN